MSNKVCCFSGHRNISSQKKSAVYSKLIDEIKTLINVGYDTFICGGALGFDTLCAQAVLEIKNSNNDIKLVLALPCKNQTKNWKQADIDIYKYILERSDEVIYISENYYNT